MITTLNVKYHLYHFLLWKVINDEPQRLKYEEIFEGKLKDQITIFKKFEQNLEKRDMLVDGRKEDGFETPMWSSEFRYLV